MSIFRINKPQSTPDKSAEVNQEPKTNDDAVNLNEPSKDGEGPTIVLDGPLSQVYTQALNKTFGFENITQLPGQFSDLQDKEKEVELMNAGTYVYCCDGKEISPMELTRISNRLVQVRKKLPENAEIIVAVEAFDMPNRSVGLLRDFSRSMGARVYMTRNRAVEAIKVALEAR